MGQSEDCYIVQDCHDSCALELFAKGDMAASTFEHTTYDDTMLLRMTQCSQGRQRYRQELQLYAAAAVHLHCHEHAGFVSTCCSPGTLKLIP